ncbi:MAG: lactate utilization protein [bacterium]|nr:lactate utilization protein [bacterium]
MKIQSALRSIDAMDTRIPEHTRWGLPIEGVEQRFWFEWQRNGGEQIAFDNSQGDVNSALVAYITASFDVKRIWLAPELAEFSEPLAQIPGSLVSIQMEPENPGLFDLGICSCELFLAETGTIAQGWHNQRPRAISLLPPNVIFIAKRTQIVAHLEDALEQLPILSPNGWVWIGGPSRTADIEKVLVKGIHGPKRTAILLL